MDIEVKKCEQIGREIHIVLEPKVLVGDTVYTKYTYAETTIETLDMHLRLCIPESGDILKENARCKYDRAYYEGVPSQGSAMDGVAMTRKDAARLWFNDMDSMLGLDVRINRRKSMEYYFSDDQEFLLEIKAAKEKMEKRYVEQQAIKAKKLISEAIELLKDQPGGIK